MPLDCNILQQFNSVKLLDSSHIIGGCDRESYRETEKEQKFYYSGKKKRHTLKTQIVVDKKTKQVICTNFSNGKKHDFRLFKESKILIHHKVKVITDTGYQGIQKIHNNSELPKKETRKIL